jgi:hypothetical protein
VWFVPFHEKSEELPLFIRLIDHPVYASGVNPTVVMTKCALHIVCIRSSKSCLIVEVRACRVSSGAAVTNCLRLFNHLSHANRCFSEMGVEAVETVFHVKHSDIITISCICPNVLDLAICDSDHWSSFRCGDVKTVVIRDSELLLVDIGSFSPLLGDYALHGPNETLSHCG